MSYNISHSEYLSGSLSIRASDARALIEELDGGKLPEVNFLHYLPIKKTTPDDAVFVIKEPWWQGDFSGFSFGTYLPRVLEKTTGEAVIVFTWEGGDSTTAVRIKNGKSFKVKAKVCIE